MRLQAVIEQHEPATDGRATTRRSLKLAVRSQSPSTDELQVVIHNISRTGLLVEAPEGSLAVGDGLYLEIPEDGAVESRVVWESGRYFGCMFGTAVSQAAVSGALLQGEPQATTNDAGDVGLGAGKVPRAHLVPERNFSAALALALLLWGGMLGAAYVALA